MKILCISDTHARHRQIPKEWMIPADILIHSGDISNRGALHEVEDFLFWFSELPGYRYKIYIPGNHDFSFEKSDERHQELLDIIERYGDVILLNDSEIIIESLKVYGSPWQPEFCNWAFNLPRGEKLAEKWKQIPDDVDILITHGPPHGSNDRVFGQIQHLGCQDLKYRVNQLKKLKLHVYGHIHSGNGIIENGYTSVNASILNELYYVTYEPRLVVI